MRLHSLFDLVARTCLVCLFPILCIAGLSANELTELAQLPAPKTSESDHADLIKILDEMDHRRNSVRTVVATMHVCLRDVIENKSHDLDGVYLGDNRGNVRMRISRGDSIVLDLAFQGDNAEIFLPRVSRFFRGSRADLSKANGCELSLLAQIGSAHDLFYPRAWTDKAVARRRVQEKDNGREVVKVLEQPGLTRRAVRRFVISNDKPVADEIGIFLHDKNLLGSVFYDDYRFPKPKAGSFEDGDVQIAYPGHVKLTTPKGNREMSLDVEKMMLNEPIPLEKFEIKNLPEDVSIKDLGAALQCKKALWE